MDDRQSPLPIIRLRVIMLRALLTLLLMLISTLMSQVVFGTITRGIHISSTEAASESNLISAKLLDTQTSTPTPVCGLAWNVVTSPNASTRCNYLNAVEAVSSNNVWAVGVNGCAIGAKRTLIERWDGGQWSVVASPNPDYDENELRAVSAVSATDIWAVGFSLGGLIEHWDGNQWSIVPGAGPNNYEIELNGIAAVSSNDVWIVGDYYFSRGYQRIIWHWNGTQWSSVPSPDPNPGLSEWLYGVAAISANDVWAVGEYNNGNMDQTLTMHWDGTQWSIIPSPNGAGINHLYAVTAISTNDVWAVGAYGFPSVNTLTMHWDGTQWSIVPSPSMDFLQTVAAVSTNDIWAAGFYNYGTLVEHWDGTQWSVANSPNPGITDNEFFGITAASPTDVWAVGYQSPDNRMWTLTERYADPCATPTPMPTPTNTPVAQDTLAGHANWQGRPPQPDPLQQLPVTLTLKSDTTEVSYPSQTTDGSGNFSVSVGGLANGAYSWRVKGPKYLANSGLVTLNGDPITSVEIGLMRVGDANNDNYITISDFNIMKVTFGKGCGDPGYDDRADFTGDCFVNISDFNLMKRNFGQEGAPPISP